MTSSEPKLRASRRASIALVAATLTTLTVVRPAAADEPPRSEAVDAKVPFEAGRALVRAGRFAEAIREFEASIAIKPTVGAYLNLGDCNEKIGHYVSAMAAFERAAVVAEANGETTRAAEARGRGEGLKPATSSIVLLPGAGLESATFLVDGQPVDARAPRLIDGGEHTVLVRMPCRLEHQMRVNVGVRADARVVPLAASLLRDDPSCAPAPVAPSGPPRPVLEPASRPTTLAIVLGASGLALLGIGTAFAIDVAGKKSDLDSACTSYPRGCPAARKSDLDDIASSADRSATFATIGVVAGVALLGTAVALHLFAKPARTTASVLSLSATRLSF